MKVEGAVLLILSVVLGNGQALAQMTSCNCQNCGTWSSHPGFGWRCEAGYHANNLWPAQYIPTSRCAVNSAYVAMINNGWRRQNLLGQHHFEEGSGELTKAGKMKAKWILTQAPQDRRMIYVERGEDQSETASRIAAVHSWASNQSPASEQVLVNDTHIVSEGHTAGSVDSIFVGFQTNQPPPVLAPAEGSGGDSSSGTN